MDKRKTIAKMKNTKLWLLKPYHVTGPIYVSPSIKPINDDQFIISQINKMSGAKFKEFFTDKEKLGLKAALDHYKHLMQHYINVQLKHTNSTLVDIESIAKAKYQKKITRIENKLKRFV